jgi:hypothetical protein
MWQPLDLGVVGPLRDANREDAERAFARLMSVRAERCRMLESLAGTDDIAAMSPWLHATAQELGVDRTDALAVDASLWLGEHIIARAPSLRWELYTGIKKSTGYQRAVLTGFTKVTDPRYYVDVAHFVASWLELCARRRAAKPDFLVTIATTTLADA